MRGLIEDQSIWRRFGAKNFEEFATRMPNFPVEIQQFIIKREYNYTFGLARNIQDTLKLPAEKRLEKIITLDDKVAFTHAVVDNLQRSTLLENNDFIIAQLEGLVKIQDMAYGPILKLKRFFQGGNGIACLREGLLTAKQTNEMAPKDLDTLLKSDYCMPVLRELQLAEGIAQLNKLSGKELFEKASEAINAKSHAASLPSKTL